MLAIECKNVINVFLIQFESLCFSSQTKIRLCDFGGFVIRSYRTLVPTH